MGYVDLRLTRENFGVKWNGIGCINDVLSGTAQAPMQHRVLIPWICGLVGENSRVKFYVYLRLVSIFFALSMCQMWTQSILVTSFLAIFFMGAALYDYTDGYIETGLFALSFWMLETHTGFALLSLVCLVGALNRETAIFILLPFVMSGEWMAALSGAGGYALGYVIPRFHYPAKRYCDFNLIKKNWETIKMTYGQGPRLYNEYTLFIVVFGVVAYALIRFPNIYTITAGALFACLLIPSMWREVRVFKPAVLACLPFLLK